MAIGLDYSLLIGIVSGIAAFVPYVGAGLSFILAGGVALHQFPTDWLSIAQVFGVMFAGQLIEGTVLSPRIVGSHVRLHPVWLIFSLFAFGYLFGFVGLLVAVPTAAALGVVARFGLQEYLDSEFYEGTRINSDTKHASEGVAAAEASGIGSDDAGEGPRINWSDDVDQTGLAEKAAGTKPSTKKRKRK